MNEPGQQHKVFAEVTAAATAEVPKFRYNLINHTYDITLHFHNKPVW
jgi:hypothetical protein